MTKYKVTYFQTTGIAEPIRLILSYANEPFEDVRFSMEEWPEVKKTIPYGRLPIVEIDGEQYHQSLAIGRYLAKKYGLAGANDKENLEIDAIVDTINDFRVSITACLWEPNAEEKTRKREVLLKETTPFYFERLTKLIKNNGGYLWGNKLTWADLTFLGLLPYMNLTAKQNILDGYPELQEYTKRISDIPNIRKWLNERPDECSLAAYFESTENTAQ